MLRKWLLMVALLALLVNVGGLALAQDDDTDADADTGPQSTVSIFAVICETQAVVNISGTMLAGFDVYFQVFSGAGGTGTAASDLRRVSADGDFDFSEIITYPEGTTVAAGGFGSVYVSISREGAPDSSVYNEFVDDIQDGCADPLNPIGVSSSSDGSVVSDEGTRGPGTNTSGTSTILSPFGGILNPNYIPPEKPVVAVGPREEFVFPRQETPGLIFAECDAFPVAEPGIVYDSDNVVIYWSWFTATEEQMEEHIANVDYSVTYYQTLPLPNVIRTQTELINGNYWTFWYAQLGNLRAGEYYIEYKVRWDEPVFDGFNDYGPGTDNEIVLSGCSFDVLPNPDGDPVNLNPWPFQ